MGQGSPKWRLNGEDLVKIAKGAGIAAGGAVIVYLANEVFPHWNQSTSTGALLAGVGAVAINFFRKWWADNSKKW